MFKLSDVSKYYNTNNVISLGLRHINLEFYTNEIVAITGESGGGKSTLLNVITKMDTFDDGEIFYYGNETSYFSVDDMDEFRKNKIGFIFQNYNIIDSYTVLENVMVPLTLKGMKHKEAVLKATELIKKVGLEKRIHHRGTKLSGGEKQRCVIARALASDCEILACDEPTGNLDSETGKEIIELIKEVSVDKLVLIVTHNFDQVKDIATRKIVVKDGEIKEDIILKEVIDKDVDKELELDYQPVAKEIKLRLAKNNLVFTPKKTILSTTVFFFIAIFALLLYQFINYSATDGMSYSNSFVYKGDDKVIVYRNDHQPLDKAELDKITPNIAYNNFYEIKSLYFKIKDSNKNYFFGNNFSYQKIIKNKEHVAGQLPTNDSEVLLVLPTDYYMLSSAEDLIGAKMSLEDDYYMRTDGSIAFTISGVSSSSDISRPVLTSNDILENVYQYFAYVDNYSYHLSISYENEDGFSGEYSLTTNPNITLEPSNYVLLPANFKNPKVKELSYKSNFLYGMPEQEFNEVKIVSSRGAIYISALNDLDMPLYEAALYGDVNHITRELDKLGYAYVIPANYTNMTQLEFFINNIGSYVLMVVSTIVIIVIYFITYVILSKIYESKKTDYTILRTLGVTKKDMRHVVMIEVMVQTIIVSIISFALLFILGKTVDNAFFRIFKNIKLFTSILYFVIILVFGYFMARRFNRRLFKYSVNKTFKKEGLGND